CVCGESPEIIPCSQWAQDPELGWLARCLRQIEHLHDRPFQFVARWLTAAFSERARSLLGEGKNRSSAELGHLSPRRTLERLIFFNRQRRLGPRVGDARNAIEPAIHRLAILLRIAVLRRADLNGYVLRLTEQRLVLLE